MRRRQTPTSVCAPRLVAVRISFHAEAKLVVALLPIALSPEDPTTVAVRFPSSLERLLGETQRSARSGGDEAQKEHYGWM